MTEIFLEKVFGYGGPEIGGARINLHHTVFVARASEATVTINDDAASIGEELGVNAVSVNPYYAEK